MHPVGVDAVCMAVSVTAVSVDAVFMGAICTCTIGNNTIGRTEWMVVTKVTLDRLENDVSVCTTIAERVDTTTT